MKKYDYRIYPSLLDSFQHLKDSEKQYDSFPNLHIDGEHSKTLEEIEDENKSRLLNIINRVPVPWSESGLMDRGTAFNHVVDQLNGNEPKDKSLNLTVDVENNTLSVVVNKREFVFDYDWCRKASDYFYRSQCQVMAESSITIPNGNVELYGYIDELKGNMVYDIKTTSFYSFGKFSKAWQKHLYTYCLTNSGDAKDIEGFEYTVFTMSPMKEGMVNRIRSMDKEYYSFSYDDTHDLLTGILSEFTDFLETNRDIITDRKIFGLDA